MIEEKLKVSDDNIEYKYIMNMYDQLIQSNIPLVMYGSGGMARNIYKELNKQSISIDYVCESKSFYKKGKYFEGKEVHLYDKLMERLDRFNIVVASSNEVLQKKIKEEALREHKINNVYIFPYPQSHYEMTPQWVLSHSKELDISYELMSDMESKQVFLSFINAHAHCIDTDVLLSNLWNEDAYFNDLYNVKKNVVNTLVDCGAYDGDSAEAFISFVESKSGNAEVFAFEPFKDAFDELKASMKKYKGAVKCYPYALGHKNEIMYFKTDGYMGSAIVNYPTDSRVEVVRGDEVLKDEHITIIKMDIEGAELDALKGFENLIKKQNPFLAVCVYHKLDDLIVIPQYIDRIAGGKYSFFLRHHSFGCDETVLYAVPN